MSTKKRSRSRITEDDRDNLREAFAELIADIANMGGTPGDAIKLFGEALQDNLEDSAVAVTKTAAKAVLDRLFGPS